LKFTELQWKLQDEMEKLISLLKQPRVDEQAGSCATVEKVLAAEREIKREQVNIACENQEQADARAAGKTL